MDFTDDLKQGTCGYETRQSVYQELEGVKRKALKFKEQEWLDEAREAIGDNKDKILNKINAVRRKK